MTSLSECPIRRSNVTATDMATLFGLNKYSSPAKMLENKLNPVQVANNHVRRGKLFEPAVIEAFLLDANIVATRHEGGTLQLPGYPISATPDAYYGDDAVVEAKSIMSHSFERWYEEIPTHYHVQVLTQMLVTGRSVGYIGALEAGDPRECEYRFIAWKIERSERMEELMKQEAVRFWEKVKVDELFRVDSKIKKEALDILSRNAIMIFPTDRPVLTKEELLEKRYEETIKIFT